MSTITGVVQEIQTRKVSNGTKTAYNVVVAGESYGVGLFAPKCKVGDYIKFEIDDSSQYKDVQRGSLKVSSHKPPAEAVAVAQATAGKAAANDSNKQETISRQSALNSAIAFLAVAQAEGALGLPKSENKGVKLKALDALLAKYVQTFYEQSTQGKWKGAAIDDVEGSTQEPAAEEPDDSAAAEAAAEDDGWT